MINKPAKSADNTAQFGEAGIPKLMLRYSLPSMVATMVSAAFNIINMTFVGRSMGPLGIAAIAICGPITMVQSSLNQLIGNGCAAAIAIKLGEGDPESCREILGSSILFNVIIAAINVIVGHAFMIPILRAFGASETIMPYASAYINIIMFGFLFGFFMMMNPMMRIEGYPKRAMMTMLLFAGVNFVCTPLFIFVFNLGIRGAALGTFCAQLSTSIWMLAFLTNKKRHIGLKLRYLRLRPRYLLQVMQLGLPTFLMNFTQSILSVVMNTRLGTYGGDIAISAWGITNNVSGLVAQPILGLNQGVQPIVGYNIGAKNYQRVKMTLYYTLIAATLISILGWLLTRLFPAQILAFFNNDPELIAVGSRMLVVFRAMIFVTGVQQAGAAYFQFAGKPKTSILLTLSRQLLILLPLVVVLSSLFQMNGILYSGPISDFTSTVIVGVFLLLEIKRLNRLIRDHGEAQ